MTLEKEKELLDSIRDIAILDYAFYKFSSLEILNKLNNGDIEDYLSDIRFVADDTDHAIEILRDLQELPSDLIDNDLLPNTYKWDSIRLLNEIVRREGWNYLFKVLEVQKNRLNIV